MVILPIIGPYFRGWLAADAAISLLLPDGKTLWLFGDSFIGEKNGEFGIIP
jgi:hypothetical protein